MFPLGEKKSVEEMRQRDFKERNRSFIKRGHFQASESYVAYVGRVVGVDCGVGIAFGVVPPDRGHYARSGD